MHNTVRDIVKITANYKGWNMPSTTFNSRGIIYMDKDGYELYFYKDNNGFELTVRNEDHEREKVFSVTRNEISTSSPLYVALIEYVLKNPEWIVVDYCKNKHTNEQ